MSVVIETTIGDVVVDLFTEERPVACLNFVKLCKLKYYNFNLFHTVEHGFIAQTGDPTGTGDGGSSVWGLIEGPTKRFFEAESLPKIKHSRPGLLSLVSVGKQLVGSQFFFTLASDLTSLDGIHCVIGEVVEGHDTLRKLNESIVDDKFRPFQDIRITHTVILDDPYPDPRAFRVPSRSPSPSAERLANGRIGADEDIDDTDGKTAEEIQEMLEEREAKARATILEIVGDLPDADMAPPENVLFVCKLNPITTDDDLEIIFGRFGKVKSCEVIRDKKSGDSLQYAFVEFEEKTACEAAYFKMDNVLIDDRRIHVDFSQSIAKVKWRGKGRGVEGVEGRLDFNKLNSKSDSKSSNQQRSREESHQNREKGRERFTSAERRKAREERHRALEQEESRRHSARSRSRGRKYVNDVRRFRNEDSSNNGRGSVHKLREYSPRGRDYQDNNSGRRQSEHQRARLKERYSLTRRQEIHSHHRSYNENHRKSHSGTEKSILMSSVNERKSVKNVNEKNVKSRKQESSSDDSSNDSSESDSTTSSSESSSQSSTSSTATSSSEDEREGKKSKSNRRKATKSSKTSKKHIRKS